MPNNFEIHIGFPNDESLSTRKVLEYLKVEQIGWVYSDVFNVDSSPNMLDPHNVPGTLGCLVSKDFAFNAPEVTTRVLKDMQVILSMLSRMRIENARVELEFVFGYSQIKKEKDLLPVLHTWTPPLLPDEMLEF